MQSTKLGKNKKKNLTSGLPWSTPIDKRKIEKFLEKE
jgi:hypothetical protein